MGLGLIWIKGRVGRLSDSKRVGLGLTVIRGRDGLDDSVSCGREGLGLKLIEGRVGRSRVSGLGRRTS